MITFRYVFVSLEDAREFANRCNYLIELYDFASSTNVKELVGEIATYLDNNKGRVSCLNYSTIYTDDGDSNPVKLEIYWLNPHCSMLLTEICQFILIEN